MREDYLEKLESMFPRGFYIGYIDGNGNLRFAAKALDSDGTNETEIDKRVIDHLKNTNVEEIKKIEEALEAELTRLEEEEDDEEE